MICHFESPHLQESSVPTKHLTFAMPIWRSTTDFPRNDLSTTSAMRSDPKPGLPDGDGYHDMILPCGLFQEIPIWKKVLFFCCLKCLNGRGLVWEDVKQDYFWSEGEV